MMSSECKEDFKTAKVRKEILFIGDFPIFVRVSRDCFAL